MYIPNDSNSDTKMRYRGCIVRVKGELVRIDDILKCTEDTVEMICSPWKQFGYVPRKTYKVPLSDVNVDKVPSQYVNYIPSKGCGLIHRYIQGRTYSLATKEDNTRVFLLGPKTNVQLLPYSIERINGKFPTLQVAWEQIMSGVSPARALTKRVALSREKDNIAVYILNNAVGIATNESTVELPYWHKYFKDELQELGFTVNLREKEDDKTS